MAADGRKDPVMPVWGTDFYEDEAVKLMTYEQQGIYWRLLWHAWVEGSIPADHGDLANLLGLAPSTFAKVWPRIGTKWHPGPEGRLINRRQEHERQRRGEWTRKLSESGTKGNDVRWGRDRGATTGRSPGDRGAIPSLSLPSSNSNQGRERVQNGSSHEGQEGQGADGEVLGRLLMQHTKILDRSSTREVVLLAAGKAAAAKGLTEPKLMRLFEIAAGKERASGWIRWVLEGDRWDEEIKLAEGAT